jgi:cellobiose phosphorylase
VAITQHILGIKPTFEGLQVAPIIPKHWQGFKVTREFRGTTYKIIVERKGPGNDISLEIDGTTIQGNIIPLPTNRKDSINVKAIIS